MTRLLKLVLLVATSGHFVSSFGLMTQLAEKIKGSLVKQPTSSGRGKTMASQATSGLSLEYDQINRWLVEFIHKDHDYMTNLQAARDNVEQNAALLGDQLGAWQQFADLLKATNGCGSESLRILNANLLSANVDRKDPKTPPVRIKKIIYQVAHDHARVCENVYTQEYNRRANTLGAGNYEMLKNLTAYLFEHTGTHKEHFDQLDPDSKISSKFHELIGQEKSRKAVAMSMIDNLRSYGTADEKTAFEGIVINELGEEQEPTRPVQVYVNRVLETCGNFIKPLKGLYEVAKFDAQTLGRTDYGSTPVANGWHILEMCNSLFKQDYDNLVLTMVRAILKKPGLGLLTCFTP